MANPRVYVEAPVVTPLPYGLLSAALVQDDLDGHMALGIEYEPAYCGPVLDSTGACEDPVDFGTASVSVNNARAATLTASGYPTGTDYTIDWGDGTIASSVTPTGSHTYAADGSYTVLVRDDEKGYVATVPITVTNGTPSGPFAGEVGFAKVPVTGIDLVDGDPFTLYHLFQCAPVGVTEQQIQDRARAALRLGEGRALERILASRMAVAPDAVDLTPTPGTAVHPAIGLAILEKYAASNYGGVPVIHTPRDGGSILATASALLRNGPRLETIQGAVVASGGGYDRLAGPATSVGDPSTVQPAAAGTAWVYVTGQAVVHRSSAIEVGPVMGRTPAVNVASTLVERAATVTWECVVGAVLIDTRVVF